MSAPEMTRKQIQKRVAMSIKHHGTAGKALAFIDEFCRPLDYRLACIFEELKKIAAREVKAA